MNVENETSGGQGGMKKRRASSLIVALWVIGLLSLIVTSFTVDAQIEGRLTTYYRSRLKAEYLCVSGKEIATRLLLLSQDFRKDKDAHREEMDQWWYEPAKQLATGVGTVEVKYPLGEGEVIVRIDPEPARRNINKLGNTDMEREVNLERIFTEGTIPEELWPGLIDSFLDWTDKDSVSRVDGGETDDYYAQLESPYKAKNGPVDTIDELLDIRGYTHAVLYGGVVYLDEDQTEPFEVRGIANLLTTYGDGKVDINAADTPVLMTLPTVDDLVAGAIKEERKGLEGEDGEWEFAPYKSINDLFIRIPEIDAGLKPYITTSSTIFRLSLTGDVGGVRKNAKAVVEMRRKQLAILQWVEEEE